MLGRPVHRGLVHAPTGGLFDAVRTPTGPLLDAVRTPTGPLFDVVLLFHVVCVVVGLVTVVVSGAEAGRCLASPDEPPAGVRRYFSGGTNWAGRVLYGVPAFGVALLLLSHGAYQLSDTWVGTGLALWAIGAVAAEGLLWPAERRIALLLGAPPSDDGRAACCGGRAGRSPWWPRAWW